MKHLLWPILILLIVARYLTTRPVYHNGDRVRITSTVYSDPINYPTAQYIKLKGLKIYLPNYPEILYGDRIIIEGVVNLSNGKLEQPKLVKIFNTSNFAASFRNKIVSFYQNSLPQPESGLLAGIVIGSKGALNQDFYNLTKVAGVAHVVVASGTNITFVVSFLIGVFTLFLTRRRAILFVILGIVLYLFISGFEAPLIRAAIMSIFLFAGEETGRLASTWRIFFLTASVMLIYKPDWILDIGFILSFVSTGSLMLFEKRIRDKLKIVPEILKEGLSTSLAAQIGVAPILFITFGQFNILSPVLNALVLWTVPLIMIIGSVGGILGLIIPTFGRILLYLSYPFLWWFVKVVQWFG
ncbi:MAG TPA: ComEC/Rec2 family competence protein [Patescibacteria group bacterium]|nr:ComEC/Rec2 family competence protein [Patescibacteria group bacterium]